MLVAETGARIGTGLAVEIIGDAAEIGLDAARKTFNAGWRARDQAHEAERRSFRLCLEKLEGEADMQQQRIGEALVNGEALRSKLKYSLAEAERARSAEAELAARLRVLENHLQEARQERRLPEVDVTRLAEMNPQLLEQFTPVRKSGAVRALPSKETAAPSYDTRPGEQLDSDDYLAPGAVA